MSLPAELSARVRALYGDVDYVHGITSTLGQPFCLFIKNRRFGGQVVCLMTYNERDDRISPVMKVSSACMEEESRELLFRFARALQTRPFDAGMVPRGFQFPVSRDAVTLIPLDSIAIQHPDASLRPGDTVYVQCTMGGVSFFHAGIYAGNANVYHFISLQRKGASVLTNMLTAFATIRGQVQLDSFGEYIHSLVDDLSNPPVFRVAYNLETRKPEKILEAAEQLKNSEEFTTYNIRYRNCQHFASRCSTGTPFSFDMANNIKFAACTLMKPTGVLLESRYGNASIAPAI